MDTEKFTLEPIDEDLPYISLMKMFFKNTELVPKEGYGIDVSKLEGIELSYCSVPYMIIGNDINRRNIFDCRRKLWIKI